LAEQKTLMILSPGPLTTVQDLGRFGLARHGVPPSGAMDSFSLRVGNRLVNNGEDQASLEITMIGPKILALTNALIAVTGADLQPRINDSPIEMWSSHILKKGEVLSFRGPRKGCRAYLSIGGGISVPEILGSRSTNLAARFGGFEGRPLRKDDVISSESPDRYLKGEGRFLEKALIPSFPNHQVLRVIWGPQQDHFPYETRERFTGSSFLVTPQSDRTGMRLSGPPIKAREGLEGSIISEGVVPGAVQIPGDAQPIIILYETVTGGYRKIATVISADLPLLGQLKPGDRVSFREVSLDEAGEAARAGARVPHIRVR